MSAGNVVQFDSLGEDIQELIRASIHARQYSYSPYSKFKVGAAIRCEDGTISTGCNVENSAFPSSICAEQTAVTRAVSDGKRKFTAIAVVADHEVFAAPCGQCRQVMAEFGDADIYLARPQSGEILVTSVKEILPFQFNLNTTTK